MSTPTINWYVSPDGLTWQLCADAGIENPVLTYRTNGCDELTFKLAGDFLQAQPYAYLSSFYLAQGTTIDGVTTYVCKLAGTVTFVPRNGASAEEDLQYIVSGPWWWLEQITYAQYFNRWNGSAQAAIGSPRVVLGQRVNVATGLVTSLTPIDAGAQISDIIDFAIAPIGATSGAPMVRGTIDTLATLPISEHTNLRCADGIRQCLRLQPDTCCYFDYNNRNVSGVPVPKFYCRKPANLSAVNIPILATDADTVRMTPRYDLQIPGVVIFYEQTNTVNGQACTQIILDQAGTIADPRCAKLLFPLQGGSTTTVQQQITAPPYPGAPLDGSQAATLSWWQAAVPWLAQIASQPGYVSTDLAITSISRSGTHGYGFYLTEGQIHPWMTNILNVHSEVETWTATVSYTKRGTNGIEEKVTGKQVTVTKLSTDGAGYIGIHSGPSGSPDYSYLYQTEASQVSGDVVPPLHPNAGSVADALFASWSRLQWDGTFNLVEQEPTFAAMPGNLVNLTGGLAAWSTMAANVQDVTVDIQSGTTKVRVGTCGRLEADSLVALWRAAHFWRYSYSLPTSMFNGSSGDTVTGGSNLARHQPDNTDPGAHQAKRYSGTDANNNLQQVQINPAADIAFANPIDKSPLTIKLVEMPVLQKQIDGSYKALKAQVLASAPYDANGGEMLSITVVTGWQYNTSSKQFEISTRQINVFSAGTDSGFVLATGGTCDEGLIP